MKDQEEQRFEQLLPASAQLSSFQVLKMNHPECTKLNCNLLVGETTGGGFETLGGDKTHCFISRNK